MSPHRWSSRRQHRQAGVGAKSVFREGVSRPRPPARTGRLSVSGFKTRSDCTVPRAGLSGQYVQNWHRTCDCMRFSPTQIWFLIDPAPARLLVPGARSLSPYKTFVRHVDPTRYGSALVGPAVLGEDGSVSTNDGCLCRRDGRNPHRS